MQDGSVVRYKLYEESSRYFYNLLNSNNGISSKENIFKKIGDGFYASSLFLKKPEIDFINNEHVTFESKESFVSHYFNNEYNNPILNTLVNTFLARPNYLDSYPNSYYYLLLQVVIDYQNKLFRLIENKEEYLDKSLFKDDSLFRLPSDNQTKITFLSYAYKDKGLTTSLYIYFLNRGGYLYIDWMHNKKKEDSTTIKRIIGNALNVSTQFLFLRSTYSEVFVKGERWIRPWCSYEIGYFSSKNLIDKMFYVSSKPSKHSLCAIIKDFKPIKKVEDGTIIPW